LWCVTRRYATQHLVRGRTTYLPQEERDRPGERATCLYAPWFAGAICGVEDVVLANDNIMDQMVAWCTSSPCEPTDDDVTAYVTGHGVGRAPTAEAANARMLEACRSRGVAPDAPRSDLVRACRAFLRPRVVQVFMWLMVLPQAWLTAFEHDKLLRRVLAPWFAAGAGAQAAMPFVREWTIVLLASMDHKLNSSPQPGTASVLPTWCRSTLRRVARESRRAVRARADAEVVRGLGFGKLVPPAVRAAVVLVLRLFPGLVGAALRIPHWIMPPPTAVQLAAVAGLDVWPLVDAVPTHVAGLAYETAFAETVFGDDDGHHRLHEALVFNCPGWADEWRARGWSCGAPTQRGLAAAHLALAWSAADATALIVHAADATAEGRGKA